MSSRSWSTDTPTESEKASGRPFHVLLVDREPQVRRLLDKVISGPDMHLIHASDVVEAREHAAEHRIDLVVVDPNVSDGSGLSLASELSQKKHPPQTIVVSAQSSLEAAIEAIRAGASDFLIKPLNMDELDERVQQAIARRRVDRLAHHRVQRLRKICQKLSHARKEVTRQVDVLCNDLVTAYQELSVQMQHVMHTSEFAAQARDELDLQRLVRKTLEFIRGKVGPTNATLFLPASMEEFTMGGYINYDTSSGSAELLLDHLADVVAPALAQHQQPVHVSANEELIAWVGEHGSHLQDHELLGVPCQHEDETLAVLILFRHQSEPFDSDLVDICCATGSLLADYLAKLIRVHHRHVPDLDGDGDGGFSASL